ncbi:DUF1428 domain-containing protein [Sphingomonas sp. GlSt437]|uniref:DUF1428 domain-containing protein n=1 Tax=Sphingomonas sp. GlSt437 TaxID=3389970 RepID=UPI003A8728B0
MAYIDGIVIAVKTADKDAYLAFARQMDALFVSEGATRIIEGWGQDVPHGQQTDFYRAVAATEDETIVFSWVEWPDKATRDAAWQRLESNPAMAGTKPPFDGKRMIFGGFDVIHQVGGD